MPIDRCYCHDRLFRDLLDLARREGLDLDALGRHTGCGTACGLCLPYLRVVLNTGRTDLPVLSTEDLARLAEPNPGRP